MIEKLERRKKTFKKYGTGGKRDLTIDMTYNDVAEDAYVYVMQYVDEFADSRPEECRLKFYDKKIGVAIDIQKRSKALSREVKLGKKKKDDVRTLTPLSANCVKCWKMSKKNAYKLERHFHMLFNDTRHVIGEWFHDYDNSLLDIMDHEIQKFVNAGVTISSVELDTYLEKNIHKFEKHEEIVELADWGSIDVKYTL